MDTIYKLETATIKLKVAETLGTVRDPENATEILRAVYQELDQDQEHFTILCLNKANKVTGIKTVSSGGQDQGMVDPRIVFRIALLMGATSLIVAHNHPSGRNEPSPEDIAVTRKLVEAGKLLDINVMDHIILGEQSFSFAERGMI